MSHKLVINCPYCGVMVKTEEKSSIIVQNEDDPTYNQGYFLIQCLSCHHVLFGYITTYINECNQLVWNTIAECLWPTSSLGNLSSEIPVTARRDIQDAHKCFTHGIYSATAVLCGRALERLIKEKAGNFTIAKGLQELKAKGIIEERLYNWAEALRKERNIGAHASEEETTKENAEDIIDFTIAIFDYIYTFSQKYAKYVDRKNISNT
jgi:hypothetical protein